MPTLTVEIPTSLKIALDNEIARVGGDQSTVVTAALAGHLGTPVHTLFQVSTSGALVAGVYSRAVSVRTILDHGDFGLGTFADLDGEMVVVGLQRAGADPFDEGFHDLVTAREVPASAEKFGSAHGELF